LLLLVTRSRSLFVSASMIALALGAGCKAQVPAISAPFSDPFERVDLGAAWLNTGAEYRIAGGKLNVARAYNHPLWLRKKLPRDVVVELDAMSKSPQGDLKIELFADGESFDADKGRYDPTGYMFVFGGWSNQLSIIGRKGEHDEGVKARRSSPPVVPGQTYHWKITRKGGQLDWQIDGQPFLSWSDPEPLTGAGQEFFGINNWDADVYFDNLQIRPAQ
jgi:hypothetical protein